MSYSLKQKAGAVLYDVAPFIAKCQPGRHPEQFSGPWVYVQNRKEKINYHPNLPAVECEGEYTRSLHLCNVFPRTGKALLRTALKDWPIILSKDNPQTNSQPEITFIIGHRGLSRAGHLLRTLESIASQKQVRIECIVVEQDHEPLMKEVMPSWVRHVHAPPPTINTGYNRSWAFNIGAKIARAPVLVLHDNDMLVPAMYASECLRRIREGNEILNLKRFIFYCSKTSSEKFINHKSLINELDIDSVVSNLLGGGSVAITCEAYKSIGGFDEDFIGWGGEDNEFWDRCLTRKVFGYAYLPIVHLWHEAQPGKRATGGQGLLTAGLTEKRRGIGVKERIRELTGRDWGRLPSLLEKG